MLSDGDVLLPMYEKYGPKFLHYLDGEFAVTILDLEKGEILIMTDTFGTKPLFYALFKVDEEDEFGVASYKSALLRAGAPAEGIKMVDPNTMMRFQIRGGGDRGGGSKREVKLVEQSPGFEFDLRQFKTSTDDVIKAFEEAVEKRVKTSLHPPFLGLSAGYDAGAIALALSKSKTPHYTFSIVGAEDMKYVEERMDYAKDSSQAYVIQYGLLDFYRVRNYLMSCSEPFEYSDFTRRYVGRMNVVDDDASIGLAYIMTLARKFGTLVYLTGSGGDELLT